MREEEIGHVADPTRKIAMPTSRCPTTISGRPGPAGRLRLSMLDRFAGSLVPVGNAVIRSFIRSSLSDVWENHRTFVGNDSWPGARTRFGWRTEDAYEVARCGRASPASARSSDAH